MKLNANTVKKVHIKIATEIKEIVKYLTAFFVGLAKISETVLII